MTPRRAPPMRDGPERARWLDAEAVAGYVSIRPDYVARYVRTGKLPKPRHPFGQKQPRWDREELDAWMGGRAASSHHAIIQRAADEIARSAPARRANRPQNAR